MDGWGVRAEKDNNAIVFYKSQYGVYLSLGAFDGILGSQYLHLLY